MHDTGHDFAHSSFTVITNPFAHSLCGDLAYTTTFVGATTDLTSDPMTYDTTTRTFSLYSEDFNLLGMQPITVQAYFEMPDYQSVNSGAPVQTEIEIKDPCIDPFSLVVPGQPQPSDYYYTADSPALELATIAFVVEPSVCDVTYSCSVSPGLDICSVSDGFGTEGIFDSLTGRYSFVSTDIVMYPPGTYTMQITGTSGLKVDTVSIEIVLVNPCLTVDLDIQPNPFGNREYFLKTPEIEYSWKAADLVSPKTAFDCGPLSVEFFQSADPLANLRKDLFFDDRTNDPENSFKVLYNEDESFKGSYPIHYRVFLTNYPVN